MADFREISGNTIGNNAIIVQGDLNTTDAGSFLNKISKTDPYYDKERILETKGPFLHESFSWILDHEGFKKWRYTTESGVLWIKGDPGKGKTMLLCGIIEDLEKHPGPNTNLGYFFCQATDSRINSATSVVAGLIVSLVNTRGHDKQHTALLGSLHKKYNDKLHQLEGPNAWAVLCDIFETVIKDAAAPICIVDALDECKDNRKPLLNLIVDTSAHVKWLLSSRNVKDIERDLRKIESNRRLSLELKANAENISKSVDTYIDNSIQDIEALEDDHELQIQTAKTLKKKQTARSYGWLS
ncbi:uncharacterized protein TrAtP1_012360 [Trichoderma atroviride]|uniref:uncharacterized protein n=1 Tax=Hypocrea atroviridis TaxID=63577 RepID=UPI003318D331|nr:hypothetical protein TrAtP1_012360 [Trichoderma atroviride]